MSVEDDSADVFNIRVIFEGSLEELLSFAECSNLETIVLIPFSEIEDSINNVWLVENIPFKNFCLPWTIFRSVCFHAINKESTHFLEFACLTEDFSNLMDICGRVSGNHCLSKLNSLLRVSQYSGADHLCIIHVYASAGSKLICFIDSSKTTES